MAANKFATMLHRNTNKITLILIYALLEWTLILLLLLNSLFSYLIIKFAVFFGLKPPCLWCTRLDHVFKGKTNNNNIHRDLLCELHAKEISNLGYCSNHHKLAESQDMCEDCLSSGPGLSDNFAFFPWIKEFQNGTQKVGEISSNCSCCGVSSLNSPIYSSYVLLKTSSWDVLECANKENLITEAAGDSYSYDNHTQQGCDSDEKKKKMMTSDFASDLYYYDDEEKVLEDKNESQMLSAADENMEITEKEREKNGGSAFDNGMKELKGGGGEYEKVDEGVKKEGTLEENSTLVMKDKSIQVCVEEDGPSPQHLEFFLDYSGHKLVPVELIDSMTEQGQSKDNVKAENHENDKDQGSDTGYEVHIEVKEDTVMENRSRVVEVDGVLDLDINEEPKFSVLDSMEMEEDGNSLVFHAKDYDLMMEELDNFANFPVIQFPSEDGNDVQEMARGAALEKHSDVHTECEELAQMENNENEADVSIGTDIPDLDITDELKNQESDNSYECTHEGPSTNSANLYEDDDNGPIEVEEQMVELHCLEIQNREHLMNNQPSFNEIEEKFPDTPTSVDSFTQLHKKLLFLEKRDSGTEESIDGSVTSELECGDGVVTVERLKAALRAERKALQALYAELEEERSASAVAANQTMAMINRLQEEKAAMQMEALQYQRMMDEQSEYDQEALQLLNELMVKREKELEVYRKKLVDYETKEKIRVLKKSNNGSSRSGFSSASCSNAEDSDGLSIDLNQEAKEEEEEEGSYGHEEYGNQSTPVDAVVNLEESLADFEDERLSILAQLKVLEEKLMTLDEDNEQHFEDVKEMEDFHEDHGDENAHPNGEANGHANGFLNGKHHQQSRIAGQKGKSLLPLFDAISDENGDLMVNGNGNGFDSNGVHESYVSKFEIENKKVAIEEEVDHLYERLQALEADKEFLKHCVSSLKKGDKGMDLLQEILQHLRDLRNVELRVRNISDSAII